MFDDIYIYSNRSVINIDSNHRISTAQADLRPDDLTGPRPGQPLRQRIGGAGDRDLVDLARSLATRGAGERNGGFHSPNRNGWFINDK
jgi:hypothetical protein